MQLPVTYLASDNISRQWFFPQSIGSHFQIFPPTLAAYTELPAPGSVPFSEVWVHLFLQLLNFENLHFPFSQGWKLLSAFFCHCYLPVLFLLVVLQYTSNKSILCIKFTLLNSCRSFIFADLTLTVCHSRYFFLSGRHGSFKEEEIHLPIHIQPVYILK